MERYPGQVPLIAAIACLLAVGPIAAETATYSIEPSADSNFTLKVYKTGLFSGKVHIFEFKEYGGSFAYNPETREIDQAELTIESDSIICLDDWVSDKDLQKILKEAKGPMLGVDEYPRMTFRSSGKAKLADGAYAVAGDLTIQGKARPVTVTVKLSPAGGVLGAKGEAEIKLKDYGLKPPSAAFGTIGTKNEMDFSFAVEARAKP